jgi:fucose 4-O-acetylase-like acetyltransferase
MILIVIGHVFGRMGQGGYDSALSSIIHAFNLPLFFFISGFFAYRTIERWNASYVSDILKRKVCAQIICPILFFALDAYIANTNYWGWIHHGFSGYWFTIVLFQMYVMYLIVTLLAKVFRRHWLVDTLMIAVSIVLLGVLIFFRGDSQLWEVLCYENLTKYFQFFTLGILVKKYFNRFAQIISNDKVKAVIILSYIGFLILYFCESFNLRYPVAYQAVHDILVRYAGLLVIFILFFDHKAYFDGDSKVPVYLRFIGRRTLDIYMIHYLLLPNLQSLHEYLSNGNMIVFQLFLAFAVAVMVISICLLLSQMLRSSKYLSYFLFGEKYK